MPKNQIVFDIETQKTFDEVGGGRNLAELKISVVGAYFYATDEYRCFEEKELPEFEERISKASRIIGFNIRRFDLPVLQPYLKYIQGSQIPALDLLEELEKTLGHRISLQSVATATLNAGKSGSGLDAIRYYRSGEIDKLKKYCLDDVRLTKEIYEFGKNSGLVSYLSRDATQKLSVKVAWQDPAPPQNLSLF
jgi:DEAD/DEAH box helicase domain-containing protein